MGKKKGKKSSAAANRSNNAAKTVAQGTPNVERSPYKTANDSIELRDESRESIDSLGDLNASMVNLKNEDLVSEVPSSESVPVKPENKDDQANTQSSKEVEPLFADKLKEDEVLESKKEERIEAEEPEKLQESERHFPHIQKQDISLMESPAQESNPSRPSLPPPLPSRRPSAKSHQQSSGEEKQEDSSTKTCSPPEALHLNITAGASRSGSQSSEPSSPRPKPPSLEGSPVLESALKRSPNQLSSPRPVPPTPSRDVSSPANVHKVVHSSKPTSPVVPPRKPLHGTLVSIDPSDQDSEEVSGLRSFHKVPAQGKKDQKAGQGTHNKGIEGLNLVSPKPIDPSSDSTMEKSEKPRTADMLDVDLNNAPEGATPEHLATPTKLGRSKGLGRYAAEIGAEGSPSSHLTPKTRPETQSTVSPPLPARGTSIKRHSVPPPLDQEMQSEDFRRSMALTHARDTKGTPPPINRAKRLESAAEINLIANRFRETRQSYQTEDEASRENIEKGQSALKSTFSTFLESLPPTPVTPAEKFEAPQVPEVELTPSTQTELEQDELHLLKTDWSFWTQVVNDFDSVATNPEKLERKITDGIPQQIRGIIWQLIANSKSVEFEDIYNTLRDTESLHVNSIRRDMKRTKFIPEHKFENLFNVIKVYSVYDPDVGYTQGMAFLVTPLLLKTETESEAFGLLVRLMKNYGLRNMYLPEMPGLMLMLYQFDRLLEENSPQLYNHLMRQGVRSSMYATQWFLTFFAYKFPLEFVLRIYDIVFVEGVESFLRFAVNLMLKNMDSLLELQFDKLLDFLKEELFFYYLKVNVEQRKMESHGDDDSVLRREMGSIDSSQRHAAITDEDYDVDKFVYDAMNDIHITPISLRRYTSEYEEIHEIEQQKEAQYESMRIKNQKLQKEVRKLENSYTLLNREHVDIANELIKNRLKIETLSDENNDMKTTVLELRKQLEELSRRQASPSPDNGIPSDIRHDLSRTIKRNAEVMSENLRLQDRVTELEKSLAMLKTKHAVSATTTPTSSNAVNMPREKLSNSWSGFKKVFKKDETSQPR